MLKFEKVAVMDYGEAVSLPPQPSPWAVISIADGDGRPAEFDPCPNRLEVLHLNFDDVERLKRGCTAFNLAMANKVWSFLSRTWDKTDLLVVHCLMGARRSPAIAAAICAIKHGVDDFWFENRTPNRRVYDCMIATGKELK